ncbi:MAG: hypothetical protein PVJ62_04030 [Deltaproteobacteria bacterium]
MSKAHQALHYRDHMVPNTRVVFTRSKAHTVLSEYAEKEITKSVVKEDRGAMGLGDYPCWSLNELARTIMHTAKPPVVIQPVLEDFKEIRLVILEDTIVAKEKSNSDKIFWKNRIFGGVTKIMTPGQEAVEFGKEMMKIGRFPWAYMDLFIAGGAIFLSEINLSGSNSGLKAYGLNKLKRKMIEKWLEDK